MYLSNENCTYLSQRTDNAQRAQLSPYSADTMHELLENSMKPDINSIENSVDPDQLASKRSQLIWINTVFNKTWHCEFIIN